MTVKVYYVRKVAVRDAGKEIKVGRERLVFVQTGPSWFDVDAYLTDAPKETAGEFVQAVLLNNPEAFAERKGSEGRMER